MFQKFNFNFLFFLRFGQFHILLGIFKRIALLSLCLSHRSPPPPETAAALPSAAPPAAVEVVAASG